MSLFFDAVWFDARLAARGLDRNDMAAAAGLERSALHGLFTNARAATPAEMAAFAELTGADMVEIELRCGIAHRAPAQDGDPTARIESIEARLDQIDTWLNELEAAKTKKRA